MDFNFLKAFLPYIFIINTQAKQSMIHNILFLLYYLIDNINIYPHYIRLSKS